MKWRGLSVCRKPRVEGAVIAAVVNTTVAMTVTTNE